MRRDTHILANTRKSAPGAEQIGNFAAGRPPSTVREALLHHRLDQLHPVVVPGHADALRIHARLFGDL